MSNSSMEKDYQHDFFDTSGIGDFKIAHPGVPPAGYPQQLKADSYCSTPFDYTYNERREALLDHCCQNPAGNQIKGYYYELARLYRNRGPIHQDLLHGVLDYINRRYDCADFVLLGIMRILYQFFDSELLEESLKSSLVSTVHSFKYHPEEPGIDSMCTWTENHQIMFAANAYLAGQKFPEAVFSNSGQTGLEKMDQAGKRIEQWLNLRFQTGFSEWLSHVYYDEDITALVNLVDFCENETIAEKSAMVLDLMLFDMALNSRQGIFGCSHGRSYAEEKRNALVEATIDTQKLMFGMGIFAGNDNMGAVSLALSERYQMPQVLFDIAGDAKSQEIVNRQRMSFKITEADKWGVGFNDLESGMVLLSMEAYNHPRTINLFLTMLDRYNWWQNQFFKDFARLKPVLKLIKKLKLLPLVARLLKKDIARNTRDEVNVYTYKTPDYSISSAQDYRKGFGGDQQHIWQATLGPKVVCFTTHPGHKENTSGGYWVGSGTLPRVAQLKNVIIACYNVSRMPGIYMTNKLFFTHAWFPKTEFDEVREENGWVCGRKGEGYLALYSQNGYTWQTEGDDAHKEMIARGSKNIWICEMGREAVDRDFSNFVSRVAASQVDFKGQSVRYHSASSGKLEFGWQGAFKCNGETIPLDDYPRYENPFCKADFAAEKITITKGDQSLHLNFREVKRTVSQYVK